ncbi:hypothetical protein XU18_0184 [Perkinsela sp. CCAP 1560/4]|nr:hypothetical protein XU18_0184 [Perkinsela sp. CCAP 1560/4]|eukprot:KNH09499.1 hypothetical protein XU18_0184 [Perkinsela sp. CCAP 1560/4]
MFNHSALSQDLSSLWSEARQPDTGQIEIQICFDKSFPALGGNTGRIKYALVPHHNECHLRDEIALYMKRFGVEAKFLMKVGQDLIDDITYERSILQVCKSNRILKLSVVPLVAQPRTLTASNLNQYNQKTTSAPPATMIDFTGPCREMLQSELAHKQKMLHPSTIAPSLSLVSPRNPHAEAVSSKNSTIATRRTSSSASSSIDMGQSKIHTRGIQKDSLPQPGVSRTKRPDGTKGHITPENDEVLRRHEVRNLRSEYEKEILQKSALRKTKVEKGTECPLCGIDTASDDSLKQWISRYNFLCKRMSSTPRELGIDEWRELLNDRLGALSKKFFLRRDTGSLFSVHLGCAEISWDWQRGEDMDTVIQDAANTKCDLCRGFGASCVCSHPNCDKVYHTSCALFSPGEYPWGYVSFGLKPHLRRCPKCPQHREQSARSTEEMPSTSDLSMVEIDTRQDEAYRQAKRNLV